MRKQPNFQTQVFSFLVPLGPRQQLSGPYTVVQHRYNQLLYVAVMEPGWSQAVLQLLSYLFIGLILF